jgi:pimeloyl-ACP methyl ester carboxylesterase
MGRTSRRLLLGVAGAIGLALMSGLAYESIASRVSASRYPAPGDIVDVDGRSVHLHCTGEGSPTVVLEAGLGAGALSWAWVQPAVAEVTRVCSYDRPGYGWSDPVSAVLEPSLVARDLRALLATAGVEGPLVLVGHSLGGHYVRLYADAYPDDVEAVVLVDARHPDFMDRVAGEADALARSVASLRVVQALSRFGLVRLVGDGGNPMATLPDGVREAAIAHGASPRHLAAVQRELRSVPASDSLASAAGTLGDRPLVVLVAGRRQDGVSDEAWTAILALQRDFVTLSTDTEFVPVSTAHHLSILSEDENARRVGQAITDVVERLRD